MMRRFATVSGHHIWKVLMTPAAKRGTTNEVVSRYAAAVIMGLVSWWAYTHR